MKDSHTQILFLNYLLLLYLPSYPMTTPCVLTSSKHSRRYLDMPCVAWITVKSFILLGPAAMTPLRPAIKRKLFFNYRNNILFILGPVPNSRRCWKILERVVTSLRLNSSFISFIFLSFYSKISKKLSLNAYSSLKFYRNFAYFVPFQPFFNLFI